jgi:hypothetical protein
MVTALVAVCLVILLGMVALVIDGGLLRDDQRQIQAAADTAALSAGDNLFANYQANQGLDPKGTAAAAATAAANKWGFTNVVVNIPPLSGAYAGKVGFAEVIVTYTQKRFFSLIYGSAGFTMSARAVAQGRWVAPKDGILLLDPTSPGALTTVGGGTMSVNGAPLIIDSNSPTAANATGSGTVAASEMDITGVPGTGGSGNFVGTIYNNQRPTPDPLAFIPEPDPSTMVVQSKNPTHISGTTTTTLYPGVYKGGISVTGQGMLIMQPGIYYMDGGGFSFTGQGSMTAVGVMIVNAPKQSNDIINISGTGAITMSPPTSGIYYGISLWQTRSSTNTVSVTGNGNTQISGTFYAQHGTLGISGNGVNDVVGSQYISYDMTVNGGGSFSVNWNPNTVAKTRVIGLVE